MGLELTLLSAALIARLRFWKSTGRPYLISLNIIACGRATMAVIGDSAHTVAVAGLLAVVSSSTVISRVPAIPARLELS